jgi:1-deoxy-D-xylulose-5-phosphate reductoisomerase
LRNIAILGSTGSIGTQTLEVIRANPGSFGVSVLAAHSNDLLLEEQIGEFCPALAVLTDKSAADRLVRRYKGKTKILSGEDGLIEAAIHNKTDAVLTALVGFAGLKPTLAAIHAKKTILLANKETLVAAGEIVTKAARDNNVAIIPVDSEHSAIFQCLQSVSLSSVRRLLLTASGGPFRGMVKSQLQTVGVADCLNHPNWSMGKKITVDSATLANKGLEVIEARWLFGVDYDSIKVVVHPQSIIHSMVEFHDGCILAQLGLPDMRAPIQYAMTYPERSATDFGRLDFSQLKSLTFEQPDTETFVALPMAYEAGRKGNAFPCVFNAANEIAVNAFLSGEVGFLHISEIICDTLDAFVPIEYVTLEELVKADNWARRYATEAIRSL